MSSPEPFEIIEVAGDTEGPSLLIVAAVHGDEYEGIAATRKLALVLESRWESIRGKVILIPIVNESAFSIPARCGSDGKDLARAWKFAPSQSPATSAFRPFTESIPAEVDGMNPGWNAISRVV